MTFTVSYVLVACRGFARWTPHGQVQNGDTQASANSKPCWAFVRLACGQRIWHAEPSSSIEIVASPDHVEGYQLACANEGSAVRLVGLVVVRAHFGYTCWALGFRAKALSACCWRVEQAIRSSACSAGDTSLVTTCLHPNRIDRVEFDTFMFEALVAAPMIFVYNSVLHGPAASLAFLPVAT